MAVRDRIVMNGDGITDAKSLRDPDAIDGYYVQMRLDDESSIQFASLTGRNVQNEWQLF